MATESGWSLMTGLMRGDDDDGGNGGGGDGDDCADDKDDDDGDDDDDDEANDEVSDGERCRPVHTNAVAVVHITSISNFLYVYGLFLVLIKRPPLPT